MIRCIDCQKEAEFILAGSSLCRLHFELAVQEIEEKDNEL